MSIESRPNGKHVVARPNGKLPLEKRNGSAVEAQKSREPKPRRKRKPAAVGVRAGAEPSEGRRAAAPVAERVVEPVAKEPSAPHVRARREPSERTGPRRNLSNAFRAAESAAPSDSGRRAVESAVEAAYRICEDYLQWGRAAASSRDGDNRPSDDRREPMRRHPYAMPGMVNPFMKWWADMACMWMGPAMPFWSGGWAGGSCHGDRDPYRDRDSCGPRDWYGHGCSTPEASCLATALTLSLDAGSSRVEAVIYLRALPKARTRKVTLVRDGTHEVMQIDVNLNPDRVVKVSIQVPEGQEPGKYRGVLSDDDAPDAGTIVLEITKN